MENDDLQQPSSTSENPNHRQGSVVSISNSEEHRDQVQVTSAAQSSTRLYECSFCKKGFSNAQALGGHMNIHRKDKAKIKQTANSSRENVGQRKMTNPLTLSNPSSSSTNHEDHHHRLHHKLSYESHVALAELKQLPLFVDTAGTYKSIQYYSTDHDHQPVSSEHHHSWEENRASQSHQELDLELRLGVHDPRPKPAVALGTRKFF